MMKALSRSIVVFVLLSTAARTASAQAEADSSMEEKRRIFKSIDWADGPTKGTLGTVATVNVPTGCQFTGAEGTKKFMELTENPTSGIEQGTVYCRSNAGGVSSAWFVVYEYDPSGYVKDDEKAKLDGKKILGAIKEGTEAGNELRRKRGWTPIEVVGWERAPYYDQETHHLTWATRVVAVNDTTINHSVRILGRGGVLKADLVISPAEFADALPTFDEMIDATTFLAGQTYSEWRSGDKVAEYGLTALVAGGAAAAAMNLGLFGKLWKVIAAALASLGKALVAVVAAIGAFFKRLFGKKDKPATTPATK
jgi:uncharacterized membrane-anchored protein